MYISNLCLAFFITAHLIPTLQLSLKDNFNIRKSFKGQVNLNQSEFKSYYATSNLRSLIEPKQANFYVKELINCPTEMTVRGCSSGTNKVQYVANEEIILIVKPSALKKCIYMETVDVQLSVFQEQNLIFKKSGIDHKIVFPPYTFEGEGKRNILVTFVGRDKHLVPGVQDFIVEHKCDFTIARKNLSVSVIGGSSRIIPCQHNFKLQVNVIDPNYRNTTYKAFTYCNDKEAICNKKSFSGHLNTMIKGLNCDKSYNFTIQISRKFDPIKSLTLLKIITSRQVTSIMEIRCVTNCDTKVNYLQEFAIKIIEVPPIKGLIEWTISKDNITINKQNLKILNSSNDHFIVSGNTFEKGSKYEIIATKGKNFAGKLILINDDPKAGTCLVNPSKGTTKDRFNIICKDFTDDDPLIYELYQVKNGRETLIMTSHLPEFSDITLALPTLIVIVSDPYGCTAASNEFSVDLKVVHDSDIETLFQDIEYDLKVNDNEEAMTKINIFILLHNNITTEIKIQLLKEMGKIDMYVENLFILQATNIASILTEDTNRSLDTDIKIKGAYLIEMLSRNFINLCQNGEFLQERDRVSVAKNIAMTMDNIAGKEDPTVFSINSSVELARVNFNKAKVTSTLLLATAENLLEAIVVWLPRQGELEIEYSRLKVFCQVKQPFELNSIEINGSSVKFSKTFSQMFSEIEYISVGIVYFASNLLWWEKEIDANVPSFSVKLWEFSEENEKKPLNNLKQPIKLNFKNQENVSYQSFSVVVDSIANYSDNIEMENAVKTWVFQIFNPTGVFIVDFLSETQPHFKISITQDARPDVETFQTKSGWSNGSQSLTLTQKKGHSIVYLMFISNGKTNKSLTINFTAYHLNCLVWRKSQWIGNTCTVDSTSVPQGNNTLICQCKHLSHLSGSIYVPPNFITFIGKEPLLAKLKNNYTILIFGVIFILCFLIILIVAILADWKYSRKAHITVLNDNHIKDDYPYLIAVYTGRIFMRANTAHVAIQLFGQENQSRVHVFENQNGKTLTPTSDDWFLIYTRKYLGKIKYIELWHDDYGKNPEWYCFRITVYDLTHLTEYDFNVDTWLSIHEFSNGKLPYSVPSSNYSNEILTIATNDFYRHLRDKHRLASLFVRHPRTLFTRAEKVTLTVTFLVVHMMVSMMFFGVKREGPADLPAIYISLQEVIIATQSIIISTFLTYIILYCFRESKKDYLSVELLEDSNNKTKRIMKISGTTNKCMQSLRFIFGPRIMLPLSVTEYEPKRIKTWTIIAWVVAVVALCTSFVLVMLYGLEFGYNKSFLWITTFFLGVAEQTFFLEPLVICITSLVLAFLFGFTYIERMKFETINDKKPILVETKIKEYFIKLLLTRLQPMYKKLHSGYVKVTHEKRVKQEKKKRYITDCLILCIILLGSLLLVFSLDLNARYYTRESLYYYLGKKTNINALNVEDVHTHLEFADYLFYTILPGIHTLNWYNGKLLPMSDYYDSEMPGNKTISKYKGFCKDYASQLLGSPKLAQRRISPEYSCTYHSYWTGLFHKAYGELSLTGEDTRTYLPNWIPYEPGWRVKWIYSSIQNLSNYVDKGYYIGGSYTVYLMNNAYIVNLGNTAGESTNQLVDLYMFGFFDNLTRIVLLEFYVFNVNSRMFTQVNLIGEYYPAGVYLTKLQIEVTKFDNLQPAPEIFTSLCCVLLGSFLMLITVIRYGLKIGFKKYFQSVWLINALLIMFFGFLTVIYYSVGVSSFDRAFNEYLDNHREKLISFDWPIYLEYRSLIFLGFLSCLTTFQLIRYYPKPTLLENILREKSFAAIFYLQTVIVFIFILYIFITFVIITSSITIFDSCIFKLLEQNLEKLYNITEHSILNKIHHVATIYGKLLFILYLGILIATNKRIWQQHSESGKPTSDFIWKVQNGKYKSIHFIKASPEKSIRNTKLSSRNYNQPNNS